MKKWQRFPLTLWAVSSFTLLIAHFDGQQLFNWQAVLLANACSWTVLLESF